jgi:hypothetical protein
MEVCSWRDRRGIGMFNCLGLVADLERVRSRANARLGHGIDPRAVRRMIAKLDRVADSPQDLTRQ